MGFGTWVLGIVAFLVVWIAGVVVAGRGIGLWWGAVVWPWLVAGTGAYFLAWRYGRRDEAELLADGRRCLSCGRLVADGVAICPNEDCDGVEFGTQLDLLRRDGAYRELAAVQDIEERNQFMKRSGQFRGTIAFMPARVFWGLLGIYARAIWGRGEDATDASQMRWWASRLVLVGGVLGAVGVAGGFSPFTVQGYGVWVDVLNWLEAALVLVTSVVAAVAIAFRGPGTVHARIRALEKRAAVGAAARTDAVLNP